MTENYAILRFEKIKSGNNIHGIEAHHERLKKNYVSNPTIDLNRIKDDYHLIQPTTRYRQEIDSRISVLNTRIRKDSVVCVDTLITSGPEFFSKLTNSETRQFFMDSCSFIAQKIGSQNIISATVHMDEKTPHLHLTFVPITQDGRLSAKDIIGGKMGCIKWQDDFYTFMVKRYPTLSRGKSVAETGHQHITMTELRKATKMNTAVQKLEVCIDSTKPLNLPTQKKKLQKIVQELYPLGRDLEQTVTVFQEQTREAEAKVASATADLAQEAKLYHNLENDFQQLREQTETEKQQIQKKAVEEKQALEASLDTLRAECHKWQQAFQSLQRAICSLPAHIQQEITDFLAIKKEKSSLPSTVSTVVSGSNEHAASMVEWKTRIAQKREQDVKNDSTTKATPYKTLDRSSR